MDTIKKPFTTNQIKSTKPNAPRLERILVGQIGNSMNAGHNRTIAWKPIMAGERHKEYRLNASFKLLTPITPAYQNLLITFRTYFVPNSRVWKNAEKFTAQKGGASEIKINNVPYFNAKKFLYWVLGSRSLSRIQREPKVESGGVALWLWFPKPSRDLD